MSESSLGNDSRRKKTEMEPITNTDSILESNLQPGMYMAPEWSTEQILEPNPETSEDTTAKKNMEPKPTFKPKSPSDDVQFNPNSQPGFEDLSKTNAVLSNIKTDVQVKDIVINLEEMPGKNAGDIKSKMDSLVYDYYDQQIQPPRTIWVFAQGGDGGGAIEGSRSDFIKLVFLILLIMLIITAVFVVLVFNVEALGNFFRSLAGLIAALVACFILIGLSLAIACLDCARNPPMNIVLLVLAVICMCIVCGALTAKYAAEIVVMAVVATCIVVLCCFLLALTSFDFTKWYLYAVMFGFALFAISIVLLTAKFAFGFDLKPLRIGIIVASIILKTVFITIELQMVLGGKAMELEESEYIFGAFTLYMSIVSLFLDLLRLLSHIYSDRD